MIRLRHLIRMSPSPSEIRSIEPDTEVTFAPMEALSDGLGGLETSEIRLFSNVQVGSYNYFADGDILLAKVTPCFENGKKAIARGLRNGVGFATSEVHVIRPKSKNIYTNYLRYIFCSEDFRAEGMASMTGAGGLRRVSEVAILNHRPKVTNLNTQKAIADFLDRETARIDQLIEKKQRFLSLTARRIDALVDDAISSPEVPRVRFENIVRRMQRSVVLSEHEELVRLGLFNRGRGVFKKPAADEEGMGDSSFFFVRKGDLILSGQFAWEGAVAIATDDEEGCVVSHRYPVYRGKKSINTGYLLGVLRSGFGDFILNESSRGSAGRNRPLNTWRLGKEKIPVPPRELQEAVDRALAFERQLKKKTEKSIALLAEARAALITTAVTGQIDVKTWGKSGQIDRHLDQIEEDMTRREVCA